MVKRFGISFLFWFISFVDTIPSGQLHHSNHGSKFLNHPQLYLSLFHHICYSSLLSTAISLSYSLVPPTGMWIQAATLTLQCFWWRSLNIFTIWMTCKFYSVPFFFSNNLRMRKVHLMVIFLHTHAQQISKLKTNNWVTGRTGKITEHRFFNR